MTEKIYYIDAYVKEFDAEILSVTPLDGGKFDVVLSATAFFPEEGGQSSDTGTIGCAKVLHVYEEDLCVHHLTDTDPGEGVVHCSLDFDDRFDKMQSHSAEHILCGIIHRLFGLENVGFHLGRDEITFDVDGVLTREDLDRVETLANEAVFANIPIETSFPSPDELPSLTYRSKLDLTENVRLVKIGDVDTCACCAPHVAYTGEIGLIKILDFEKHRGGLRIRMVAGRRAVLDYRTKYANIKEISAILSEPQHTTAEALARFSSDFEETRAKLKASRLELAREIAKREQGADKNAVFIFPEWTLDELREFSNTMIERVGGILVTLCGTDGDYKYIISSKNVNLSQSIKEINANLDGRGGGKPNMVQGSFLTTADNIKSYFL